MGIGVSVGPHKAFMEPQVCVLPVRRNRYVIHVNFTVYLKTGPGPKDREFFGGDRLIMWAPNRLAWVRKLLDQMFEYDPHSMRDERQDMMRAASRALPRHLARLLLREAMRRRAPLNQKLRRSLKREHAILWKKPRGTPPDWDAFHAARNTSSVTRYRLALIKDLMRDVGEYLPARVKPPPRPPPQSYVDLKPPALRRRGVPNEDQSDCIKPKPPSADDD